MGIVARLGLQLRLQRRFHAGAGRLRKVEYNYQTIKPWGEDAHGTSVFYKDADSDIFHTYSSYGRGGEAVLGTYAILDMTPKGRNESGPGGDLVDWVKRHDSYDDAPQTATRCCG